MSKQLLKQLKDRDPAQRKAAIKGLARTKFKDALLPLAKMSGDDKDPEVRDLALKAGQYILRETGGMAGKVEAEQPAAVHADTNGKHPKYHVSSEDEKQAVKLSNDAMTIIMGGDPAKAMRALEKALALNPNLRYESYFISLSEQVTGMEGPEAIARLSSKEEQTNATRKQVQQKQQKRVEAHRVQTAQTTWRDVTFDLSLFAAILTVALFIVGFLTVQSAQGYVNKVEDNWARVDAAAALGNCPTVNANGLAECTEPNPDNADRPIEFTEMPDDGFLASARDLGATGIGSLAPVAIGAGVGATVLVFLMSSMIYFLAAKTMGGVGSFQHITHVAASYMTSRAVIFCVLVGIAGLVIFGFGGGMVLQIMGGLLALFGLFAVFKLVGVVGKAYDFSFSKALVATGPAVLVVAAIGGAGMLVF